MTYNLSKRILESLAWLDRLRQPIVHTAFADAFKELNRNTALYEVTRTRLASFDVLQKSGAFDTMAEEIQRQLADALLPDHQGIASIAECMANQVQLVEAMGMAEASWSQLLARQMAAVQTPWINPHLPSSSLEGFAAISRLGQLIRNAGTIDEPARAQLDEDLGQPINVDDEAGPEERDAAHIAAGMNKAMLTILPSGIGDVLIQTGFVFKADFAPLPATADGSDPGHVFHPGHNMLITIVEQTLRAAIEDGMTRKYGKKWIDARIDPKVSQKWKCRRDVAVNKGESPLSLIQYADFMNLADIIVQSQHWNEVFCMVFGNKDHFLTSMHRLHPIRLPLAHSRPIGIGQQFHLVSEASYVLRALGINIFKEP